MCRYACNAKYYVAYYKDRYRQAQKKNNEAHSEYTRRYADMKKLKGSAYQKARRQLERYRQRDIRTKRYMSSLVRIQERMRRKL
jgi:hypothetical protein